MRYFRARHIATMAQPLIEDGVVAVNGDRIVAVGPKHQINPPRIDEDINGILMPGLINAHTHLELTNVPRPETPGTFQDWLLTTMGSMREADVATFNRKREEAIRAGIAQCIKFGVTSVGDISQNVDIVRPILMGSALHSISFGECLGLGPRRKRFNVLYRDACRTIPRKGRTRCGVSPHAPYTVDAEGYRECRASGYCFTTHLAETPDEMAFVRDRSGPFRLLYDRMGFDSSRAELTEATSPVEWLFEVLGALDRTLLVHVNYCSDKDLDLLAREKATIAFCPRTHDYFRHPPHRWREMLERGIEVCVATDSCASSPNLNLVDDLRSLHGQAPEVEPEVLWQMVTTVPGPWFATAGHIPWPTCWGMGKCAADFISWPTTSADPLREILESPAMLPSGVWIGGEPATPPL